MEARFEGGQRPEGAAAPYMDAWNYLKYSSYPTLAFHQRKYGDITHLLFKSFFQTII
jgi:hypothetical protein